MLLAIKNLHAGYGGLSAGGGSLPVRQAGATGGEVLRGISIEIGEGEIVCLIGPNGAGKSTVLKSVMGLTTKTSGEILWKPSFAEASEGKDITNFPTHSLLKLGIGFVPQGRLVFPSLTVKENLEMGGYLVRQVESLKIKMENVFDRFPILRKRAHTKAGSLSGGEQQMLAIGRALMMTPELLMLDEPSLGLAPKITEELYEKLRELNASGTTLLIVEQNVRLVLRHAHRGYLLATGQVRFTGTARELGNEKLMHSAYLV
jgi:branched-chain amino acid transport system ATP-binding protein